MKIILILFLLAILLSYNRAKQGTKKIYRFIVILGFSALIALCINNADYLVYKEEYIKAGQGTFAEAQRFEFLYRLFSFSAAKIGLPYEAFVFLMSLGALTMINSVIVKFCYRPEYVMILYFIFPFMFDAVQLRNFFATAVIIYSMRFLVKGTPIGYMQYYICVFVAVLFHNASIIYCILPIPMLFGKHELWVAISLAIVGTIFVYSTAFYPVMKWGYELVFQKPMTYAYLSENSTRAHLGLLIPIVLQLSQLFLLYMETKEVKGKSNLLYMYQGKTMVATCNVIDSRAVCFDGCVAMNSGATTVVVRKMRKKYITEPSSNKRNRFDHMAKSLFISALVLIPFFAITSHFIRQFRNLYIVFYIVFVNKFQKIKPSNRWKYIVGIVLFLIITYITSMVGFWGKVIQPMLFFMK